ncbi:hypothetical protein SARC_06280 [Sphaeroforma arctica JP610]|uniref:Uncharacterized protein n=1 Tax=Sphaeroforma arctica JP610 TaxID=667725 RepID=A0A0L0FZK0_9EUKA|nr:hypothetical protein SARC_06280 [Sphaeroforma arctica JP610]KNC81393.1 hypothetical protein SARC_06280 [Sphaeroforma arctica JP610]|eukprot:XP_014155295.1 hypothetical protein SARC_06280 [Sphaeroforma arctica JP610]
MSQQNDEVFRNMPIEEEDSGFSSSNASATIPSFISDSSSEAEEESRPDSRNARWEPARSSEVNNNRFRINRNDMARHLERFRLSVRLTSDDAWTASTKTETVPTIKSEDGST